MLATRVDLERVLAEGRATRWPGGYPSYLNESRRRNPDSRSIKFFVPTDEAYEWFLGQVGLTDEQFRDFSRLGDLTDMHVGVPQPINDQMAQMRRGENKQLLWSGALIDSGEYGEHYDGVLEVYEDSVQGRDNDESITVVFIDGVISNDDITAALHEYGQWIVENGQDWY